MMYPQCQLVICCPEDREIRCAIGTVITFIHANGTVLYNDEHGARREMNISHIHWIELRPKRREGEV